MTSPEALLEIVERHHQAGDEYEYGLHFLISASARLQEWTVALQAKKIPANGAEELGEIDDMLEFAAERISSPDPRIQQFIKAERLLVKELKDAIG